MLLWAANILITKELNGNLSISQNLWNAVAKTLWCITGACYLENERRQKKTFFHSKLSQNCVPHHWKRIFRDEWCTSSWLSILSKIVCKSGESPCICLVEVSQPKPMVDIRMQYESGTIRQKHRTHTHQIQITTNSNFYMPRNRMLWCWRQEAESTMAANLKSTVKVKTDVVANAYCAYSRM